MKKSAHQKLAAVAKPDGVGMVACLPLLPRHGSGRFTLHPEQIDYRIEAGGSGGGPGGATSNQCRPALAPIRRGMIAKSASAGVIFQKSSFAG
jgi:hypothetical protein